MKEIDVTMYELTEDEVRELARYKPRHEIVVHDTYLSYNRILTARTVARRIENLRERCVFLSFGNA